MQNVLVSYPGTISLKVKNKYMLKTQSRVTLFKKTFDTLSNFHSTICQVAAYRKVKNKNKISNF